MANGTVHIYARISQEGDRSPAEVRTAALTLSWGLASSQRPCKLGMCVVVNPLLHEVSVESLASFVVRRSGGDQAFIPLPTNRVEDRIHFGVSLFVHKEDVVTVRTACRGKEASGDFMSLTPHYERSEETPNKSVAGLVALAHYLDADLTDKLIAVDCSQGAEERDGRANHGVRTVARAPAPTAVPELSGRPLTTPTSSRCPHSRSASGRNVEPG